MFKINHTPTFSVDVKVPVPSDDAPVEEILRTKFQAIAVDEANAFDLATSEGTLAFLEKIVVTFENFGDDNDRPMDCTPELRAIALGKPYVRIALVSAYYATVSGLRTGN